MISCALFLKDIRHIQQELISNNADTLPERKNGKFASKWARDNVDTSNVSVPDDYRQKYWTMVACQAEAARLLLAYRERKAIAQVLSDHDWDMEPRQIADELGARYVDYELVKNLVRARRVPRVPVVRNVCFPYSLTNPQCCKMMAYDDVLWVHEMAVGSARFDIVFDMAALRSRYDINKISRPTMRLSDDYGVQFDVGIEESVVVDSRPCQSVIGFDRNTDKKTIISGARISIDGNLAPRPLGPSLETEQLVQRARVITEDLRRKKARLGGLMPWQDEKRGRLCREVHGIEDKLSCLHDAIDWHVADDIARHRRAGEVVSLEDLRWAGGGFVKFRHGASDDVITHRLSRDGAGWVFVDAAGTSCRCPRCGGLMVSVGDGVDRCVDCDFEDDHDRHSGPMVAVRGLVKVTGEVVDVSDQVLDSAGHEACGRVRVAARERKNAGRRSRGERFGRVKSVATPRRPPERCGGSRCRLSADELKVCRERAEAARLVWVGLSSDVVGGDCGFYAGADCSNVPFPTWGSTVSMVSSGYGRATSYAYARLKHQETQNKTKQ